jgi:hypothetical protein
LNDVLFELNFRLPFRLRSYAGGYLAVFKSLRTNELFQARCVAYLTSELHCTPLHCPTVFLLPAPPDVHKHFLRMPPF